MRLRSITLSGFRAFASQVEIDLDGSAVIVVGRNGQGKTSLLDGILWGLTGELPRFSNTDRAVVSQYSSDGRARVHLELADEGDTLVSITRRVGTDGAGQLRVKTESGVATGPAAEGILLDLLWPEASAATKPVEALTNVLTRSVYLQQDTIRQFVEASPADKYRGVSEILGAGSVTELQQALDRERNGFTRETNRLEPAVAAAVERLELAEERLASLDRTHERFSRGGTADWDEWWSRVIGLNRRWRNPIVAGVTQCGCFYRRRSPSARRRNRSEPKTDRRRPRSRNTIERARRTPAASPRGLRGLRRERRGSG